MTLPWSEPTKLIACPADNSPVTELANRLAVKGQLGTRSFCQ